MTTLTWDRHRGHASSYDVVSAGFNFRLDELRAAIALVQLRRLEHQNAQRARIVDLYRATFNGRNGLRIAFEPQTDAVSPHHLAVLVLPEGADRDEFRASLGQRRIQTSVHYPPIHQFSAYRDIAPRRALPVTDAVSPRLVTLPLYGHMSDDDVSAVTEAVLAAT